MNRNTIWKYTLGPAEVQTIDVPAFAKLLTVAQQDGAPTLWFEVDPEAVTMPRTFVVIGTGWEIPEPKRLTYVGTTHSTFVWHLYEQDAV